MTNSDLFSTRRPAAFKRYLSCLVFPILAACGGGSDTAAAPPSTTAPPPPSTIPTEPTPSVALTFGSEKSCTDLPATYRSDGVVITGATVQAASAAAGSDPAIAQHCDITGTADPHVGVDGQSYAIKFRMRVPIGETWSGRFVFSGGGGSNGSVGNAQTVNGSPMTPLAKGDAVLTQDAGHDNVLNDIPERGGDRAFGFDPRARADNFYRSHGRVTAIAKDVIKTFTGSGPQYSYFAGCSKGGQEAAMMSQRFPEMFDGIVVGNPLLAAPLASMARPAYIAQTFAELATAQGQLDRNGLPFLNKTFTDADLAVLKDGVARQCDMLDGAADGMSQDFKACTNAFKPEKLLCTPGQTAGCLSAPQVAAIEKQMAGIPGDMSWYYDMGLVEGQFRSWWLGRHDAAQTSNNWVGRAVSSMYVTPPEPVHATLNNGSEPYKWLLNFNLATDLGKIYRTDALFTESPWDMSFATGSDLSAFKKHGGKMMIYHGVADGAFTLKQTVDWVEKINVANAGDASDFVRLYPVPGMGHCRGGPSTSSFDMLAAVQDWVEKGKVPETVLATAPAGTPWPGRTRPLCTYPKVARYVNGNIEDASSFVCQ